MKMLGAVVLCLICTMPVQADALHDLSRDFWAWRAQTQPFSYDDIPRLERPAGWAPDWSRAGVERRRQDLRGFEQRWKAIPPQTDRGLEVDRRLIGSAIMRVHWELDVLKSWQRDPHFYNEQTLGALGEALLPNAPFTAERDAEIVRRVRSIPAILGEARKNLEQPSAPFARLAVEELQDIRPRLLAVSRELSPLLTPESRAQLQPAMLDAAAALEAYSRWLQDSLGKWPQKTAIGREDYVWFLRNVALLPYTPEQMLEIGRSEWARAVAFEELEKKRDLHVPPLTLAASADAEAARAETDDIAVRRALHEAGLLDVPERIRHCRFVLMPAYLSPLAGTVETDDLTSESRLDQDGARYITAPSDKLGYFALATAKDPRLQIAHEGVHFVQLTWSWSHEDPIRRHYYDSGANEGLAFYNEEMVTQAGLFDDSPHSREIIYNMARLRALRVEVDVKLATGDFDIDRAAEYLRTMVPMDIATAHAEAAFFATNPGQAITYQIGKQQILSFLAAARRTQAESFSLSAFHAFVWKNGNVPIALQRFEYLGDRSQLDDVEKLH